MDNIYILDSVPPGDALTRGHEEHGVQTRGRASGPRWMGLGLKDPKVKGHGEHRCIRWEN